MRIALRIIGLVAAASLMGACSIFGDNDEEAEPKELVDFESSLKIKKVWNTKVGAESEFLLVGLRPVGDGARIYAASRDGNVIALDPETGDRIWETRLKLTISSGPAAAGGAVVVTTSDGYVIAMDAASGRESWRAYVAGESLAQPLIGDDSVFVQTIDNRLQSLSKFDGKLRWELEQSAPALSIRGAASPLMVGSLVVAGFDNGRLLAVDVETGDIEWDSMLALPSGRSDLARLADVDGGLAVVGQDIYAGGYQGRVSGIAAESGQILWSREISTHVGMAADWNSVYTARDGGEIVALSRNTGNDIWRNDSLLRRTPTLPVPFNTTVVVGDFEGYLHFFSSIDGSPVARLRYGGNSISSDPLVVANRLYVQSDNGSVAAFEIVDDRPERSAPDIADNSPDDS